MRYVKASPTKIRVTGLLSRSDWDDVQIPTYGFYWLQSNSSGEWLIHYVDKDTDCDDTPWGVEANDHDGWRIDVDFLRSHTGIIGPIDPPEDGE